MNRKSKKCLIGIDVGGTKMLICLLDRQFRIRAERKLRVEAHKGESHFFRSLLAGVEYILDAKGLSRKNVAAIGIGCPGIIRLPEGIVILSPNISFLKNYPLKEKLRRKLKIPVTIENDVNAGLYGEHQFGAARGFANVAGVFPGTGVGGALILNNEIYRGATGAAGEIGHIFLSLPSLASSPEADTLEGMTGRLTIAAEASRLISQQKAKNLFQIAGFDVKKIKSKALAKAIRAGDSALRELIVAKAKVLGIAMANTANLINPHLIVLGGGLVEAMPEIIVPIAKKTMRQFGMKPIVQSLKVVPAQLKDYAIVKGAAKLASDSIL